jgi:hypothetical protein
MQKVLNEIIAYINKGGSRMTDWYAGITDDPEKRLFTDHNVQRNGGSWIYRDAGTEDTARDVEQHLLDAGCDGGPGGGSGSSKYVYAYKKTSTTNENY